MPRKLFIQNPERPYNVTARCINKDWFSMPMNEVWEIMQEQLYFIHIAYGVKIHSFVLMSNHFHLIISAPEGNLSLAMGRFMRETSRLITKSANRLNQTYGSRFHRSMLGSYHNFLNVYKYNYYNPVKAGICERVELYPYSTLGGLIGLKHLLIPVTEDTLLFENGYPDKILDWLNRTPKTEHLEYMRRALRKNVFELPHIDSRVNPLEFDLL